jgi:ABC-type amino acid transport system permease subunit
MTNQFIAIIKDTALVSTPGVHLSILIVSALGRVQRWIVNAQAMSPLMRAAREHLD